jgi:adenosylmethionine-8-amino-7-oxononanoate aminotransferase
VALCPPLIITEPEIDDMFKRLGRALDDVAKALGRQGLASVA